MIELVVSWILATASTFGVVILHERYMSEERLERAWPPSSRSAAIVVFGVLVLPIHFARTLGHFRSIGGFLMIFVGLVAGALVALGVLVVTSIALGLVAQALGVALPE